VGPLKDVLEKLISLQSVTPHDAGCQDYMINVLEELGFHCQRLDNPPVANFFARLGHQQPMLVFAGHTDVVPIGDLTKWHTDPFCLHEKDGLLYGRGTADMKGSLACMLVAAARFVETHPTFPGSLGFLITSGEEGDDFHLGTPYVMEQLQKQGIQFDFCVVGEPSSTKKIGDVIKIGRRGSLTATITLHGKQGHVAYPHLADNPIHKIAPVLAELTSTCWDHGNDFFPPTTLQMTHIQSGGQASNLIPGELVLQCNFRYSTEQTDDVLKQAVQDCFSRHGFQPSIFWRLNGQPFLTDKGRLLDSCVDAIHQLMGDKPELSTSGGTSDGRFIAPYGIEVIELGPVNATIHQVNECVSSTDLDGLTTLYYALCERLLR
jgi:succinyl-diaminopimelate desuccinylase